jgi:hypothetical protein
MSNRPTAPDAARFRCATCLVAIRHRPTFHVGLAFCCAGCVADGPCICTYDLEEDIHVDRPAATALADDQRRLVGAPR